MIKGQRRQLHNREPGNRARVISSANSRPLGRVNRDKMQYRDIWSAGISPWLAECSQLEQGPIFTPGQSGFFLKFAPGSLLRVFVQFNVPPWQRPAVFKWRFASLHKQHALTFGMQN